ASVFLPAHVELTDSIVRELNTVRQMDFFGPPILQINPDIIAIYFGSQQDATVYYPNIDLASILPPDFDITRRPWYVAAHPANNPQRQAIWSEPYLDAALHGLVITCSIPVYDSRGDFRGVAAMDIQLTRITEIVANIQVGQTGYAFVIDSKGHLIALPRRGYKSLGITEEALPLGDILSAEKVGNAVSAEFWQALSNMQSGKSGLRTISIHKKEHLMAYQPVTEVGYSLALVVPTEEMLAEAIAVNQEIARVGRNARLIGIAISGGILVLTMILAAAAGNRLTRPLVILTKTAEQIEQGNLEARADIRVGGELGKLAQAFNAMADSLRETIANLEESVAERTRALERRHEQMRAALEVGSAAVSARNLETLLSQITHLISRRFGFYHVGIYLIDERREFAVLRAANSRGGQAMLARGHKLRVGEVGIVGHVTATGEARIALDVGQDKVYFQNPDLPETRSEATLPLIASGQVIGALDVQSTEEAAFQEEDLLTLRVLADQIAIAIENARLLEESQKALATVQRAYGELSQTAWHSLLKKKSFGYLVTGQGKLVALSEEKSSPEYLQAMQSGEPVLAEEGRALYAPIKVTGTPIGVLILRQKENSSWKPQAIAMINSLVNQMGTALESARLYEQIREQARRESLIARVTARIRETLDLQTILQTTVQELRRSFDLHEAEIRLQAAQMSMLTEESPSLETPPS
ncbi:MAG: cache domain-containing protein, partial [Anaerolineales bacterium]|nr:cache domain-containing protein [Anaerolineales bacterium]